MFGFTAQRKGWSPPDDLCRLQFSYLANRREIGFPAGFHVPPPPRQLMVLPVGRSANLPRGAVMAESGGRPSIVPGTRFHRCREDCCFQERPGIEQPKNEVVTAMGTFKEKNSRNAFVIKRYSPLPMIKMILFGKVAARVRIFCCAYNTI